MASRIAFALALLCAPAVFGQEIHDEEPAKGAPILTPAQAVEFLKDPGRTAWKQRFQAYSSIARFSEKQRQELRKSIAENAALVETMIQDLGDDVFRVRELASASLLAVGCAAYAAIEKSGLKSSDLEIVRRSEAIAGRLRRERRAEWRDMKMAALTQVRDSAALKTLAKVAAEIEDGFDAAGTSRLNQAIERAAQAERLERERDATLAKLRSQRGTTREQDEQARVAWVAAREAYEAQRDAVVGVYRTALEHAGFKEVRGGLRSVFTRGAESLQVEFYRGKLSLSRALAGSFDASNQHRLKLGDVRHYPHLTDDGCPLQVTLPNGRPLADADAGDPTFVRPTLSLRPDRPGRYEWVVDGFQRGGYSSWGGESPTIFDWSSFRNGALADFPTAEPDVPPIDYTSLRTIERPRVP